MRGVGENSWKDLNKIVNGFHSLAQCIWNIPGTGCTLFLWSFMSSVLQGVCVDVCSHGLERWCCRNPWSAQNLSQSISIASLLANRSLYLPPPFPSPGSEVAQLSLYPREQLDIATFAWKKLWVDALKPINANQSSEKTSWLLACGEGPSIWRTPFSQVLECWGPALHVVFTRQLWMVTYSSCFVWDHSCSPLNQWPLFFWFSVACRDR